MTIESISLLFFHFEGNTLTKECGTLSSYSGMKSLVLSHLYDGNREQFVDDLLRTYEEKGSVIVNFLYFANAVHHRLLEKHRTMDQLTYKQALLAGDFLLTDGIALQVHKWFTDRKRVQSLNGTDLTPYLLDILSNEYSTSLYVYSVYDEKIGKDSSRLEKGLDTLLRDYPQLRIARSYQSDYTERGEDFPFDQFATTVEKDDAEIKIFLNCTGTPFQEMRVDQHRQRFAENSMMVLNAGGFLDFVSGFEKRAPQRAVKSRVLETPYRIITQPRKNLKKFLRMFGIVRLWKNTIVNSVTSLFRKK